MKKNQDNSWSIHPVFGLWETIEKTVLNNIVTILTAETGAGKSTLVPIILAMMGYRVIVTQPRRLAARTLAERVAEMLGTGLGNLVGYRTADERFDSPATEILYVTDGLQLVRELAGKGGTGRKTILILDEVHEWNINIEVLVAWAKSRIKAGDDLKVVLMSATLEAQRLADFYGENVPVISVKGRLHNIKERTASSRDIVSETVSRASNGRNVLVFQPGKKEITETIEAVTRALGGKSIVLPLHRDVSAEEQQRCFDPPPAGMTKVIVATNIAQTSVTIPDIDAVVDSGVERRKELVGGIEGLYLRPISKADSEQRKGRAGRTKDGEYSLCSDTPMRERLDFPVAEIMRTRLDQTVLRLAAQGFDATTLEFFHQPNHETLVDARQSLIALGAMSADGQVTKIGHRMSYFSVSVENARMLIEAERLGVVDQVAIIAACLESGDIRAKAPDKYTPAEWRNLTKETKSDLLALLDVYNVGNAMEPTPNKSKVQMLCGVGIFPKNFFDAGDRRRKLLDAVRSQVRFESKTFASKEEEREAILKACVAGLVDHLYEKEGGRYKNGSPFLRELGNESVVQGRPTWLVGLPKDIELKDRYGNPFVLHLVSVATAVDPSWLVEVAPQLVKKETGLNPYYDAAQDSVVSTMQTFFNGQKVREEQVPDPEHAEAEDLFVGWLAGQMM